MADFQKRALDQLRVLRIFGEDCFTNVGMTFMSAIF